MNIARSPIFSAAVAALVLSLCLAVHATGCAATDDDLADGSGADDVGSAPPSIQVAGGRPPGVDGIIMPDSHEPDGGAAPPASAATAR